MSDQPALPANLDAERFVLGSIMLDDVCFADGALAGDHFSIEPHRRLFRCMERLRARGERIDAVTVGNELQVRGEFDADTCSFIASLTDGLPLIPKIDSYVRILQDKATRRRWMFAAENIKARCASSSEDLAEILAAAQEMFTASMEIPQMVRSIEDLPTIGECGAVEIEYLRDPELPRGSVVALTGDSGCGKSTLATAWARDLWRQKGIASLFLDHENPLGVIADRLERLGMEDGPGIRFWGGWLPVEAPQPDDPIIRAWAKERQGLIVVDSFSAFHSGDQNDAGEVRAFMHRCRRLADLGATVCILHHSGKGESSADYRGSSDFKASIDQGLHVSNFGTGRLDKLVIRPFKMRLGSDGEITYEYSSGRFVRGDVDDARQAAGEQLMSILRCNPGVTSRRFDELATARGISRSQARVWLNDGVLAGAIRRDSAPKRGTRHYAVEGGNHE